MSVNTKGQVFLQDSEIKIDELVAKLKAITAARGGNDERIYVRGDKTVDYGTVMRRLNERYTVADGDSFRRFVMENALPELFEARIHQGNFKEFITEHKDDGLPPGMNVMREFTIVVRKPS